MKNSSEKVLKNRDKILITINEKDENKLIVWIDEDCQHGNKETIITFEGSGNYDNVQRFLKKCYGIDYKMSD